MISRAKQRSLVSTLFARVLLLLAATIAAIGAASFWIAKHQIDEVYDLELQTGTKILYTLSKEELEDPDDKQMDTAVSSDRNSVLSAEDRQAFELYAGSQHMFRIWRAGQLAAWSKNGPSNLAAPKGAGFVDVSDATGQWRIYQLPTSELGLSVAVGEPLSTRYALVEDIALALVVPLLLLMPASIALIWLTLLDGLGTLRRLAEALKSRSGSNLVPLDVTLWPRDLIGMLTAINDLLGRLDRSFRQTSRFTDHAAHELRTPLAALKLNAQMIETEKDPQHRREIVERIREGVDRAAALVEQLLTLAHLDSGAFLKSPNDITAIARSALEELAPFAAAKEVKLALAAKPAVMVQADASLLKMVVINLVDNAIKQSPAGADVAVEIERESAQAAPATVRLVIVDHGPGIPAEERQRVFERFYRRTNDKPGFGLGLSIVAEALSQIGGTISLESPNNGQGLRAVVRLLAA